MATAREHLQSILIQLAKFQDEDDARLEFIVEELKEADNIIANASDAYWESEFEQGFIEGMNNPKT